MTLANEHLAKYMPDIILDQVSEDYVKQGYRIEREATIDGLHVDLIARKNGEVILVEVKAGNKPISKDVIAQLNHYVKSHEGHRLVIAVATPPGRKNIEVENIDEILLDYLISNPPGELLERATIISFNSVSDVEISDLKLSSMQDNIELSGTATANVHLQFGSESVIRNDSGLELDDSFEIKFHLSLHRSRSGWNVISSDDNSVKITEESLYAQV